MEKTIAAISTGHTASGIAIVRMSGPEAIAVSDKIFFGKVKPSEAPSRTLLLGKIKNKEETIDEVLLSVMRAPHSYTGEDIVEINTHGGVFVAEKVLSLLFDHGAVPAAPGEFTKRAFLNGRMDLSEAESVLDIIDAKNNFALKAGNAGLAGKISGAVKAIREKILDECAFIEAALDDPEHYDLTGYEDALMEKLQRITAETESLYARSEYGKILKEGVRTVIAGRPNAGKSSLFNLLTGFDTAIVTDIAGTTRDVLERDVRIGSLTLVLMDTAGLRTASDVVEKIGVDRAKEAMADADLILYVIDGTVGLTDEDKEILESYKNIPTIFLWNKIDKVKETTEEEKNIIPLSCVTRQGLSELEKKIEELFLKGEIVENDEVYITNERQKNLLKQANESLRLVEQGIREGQSEEFLTVDLMNAYTFLGQLIGESVQDDVIDRVFEKFCMGK